MFVSEHVSVDSIIHAVSFLSQRDSSRKTEASAKHFPDEAMVLPKPGNKEDVKEMRKQRKQLYQQNSILMYQQDMDAFKRSSLNRNISSDLSEKFGPNHKDNWFHHRYLLLGLHACGDLSAQLCRMFISSSKIQCLAVVGCCYHMLSENSRNESDLETIKELSWMIEPENLRHPNGCHMQATSCVPGFPLSHELQKTSYSLGAKARKRTWSPVESPEDCAAEAIRYIFHRYRVVLQLLFIQDFKQSWEGRQTITGSLSNAQFASLHMTEGNMKFKINGKDIKLPSFSQYVSYTLDQMKFPNKRSEIELEEFYQQTVSNVGELHIDALFSLQLIITTLNEAIILVDRYVYLQENHCVPELFPIFSPVISPRNMILVARKQ
jgi:hypothetical protein